VAAIVFIGLAAQSTPRQPKELAGLTKPRGFWADWCKPALQKQ
jgi:hypothetical protein